MNNRIRVWLGSALLALGACSMQAAAEAPAPDFLAQFVYPHNGASSADDVFVLYADNCGRPHPDPTRAASVTRSEQRIVVDLYLVEPEHPFCLAVLAPDELVAIPVGRLPRGVYQVIRRLHVRSFAGHDFRLELESTDGIEVGDAPNPAVSGSWYDRSMPGAGVIVTLLPPAPGDVSRNALLFVLTRRIEGEPIWLAGVGPFIDGVLRAALLAPDAPDGSMVGVPAVFTYTGCGEGRLRVDGIELEFPFGEASVQQLTVTAGLPGCRPPAIRPDTLH